MVFKSQFGVTHLSPVPSSGVERLSARLGSATLVFVMEEDIAFRPMDIGFLCGVGIVFDANGIPSMVK